MKISVWLVDCTEHNTCRRGTYTDVYSKTVGVDFMEKVLYVDHLKEDVKFMVWDTLGEYTFNSITRNYYKGARNGCVRNLSVCAASESASRPHAYELCMTQ